MKLTDLGRLRRIASLGTLRVALFVLAALATLVAGMSMLVRMVSVPGPDGRPQSKPGESLNIATLDAGARNKILGEEALLLDPTPLFLPTPHNYAPTNITSRVLQQSGESFKAMDGNYVYPDETFSITFPDPVKIPAQPVDGLAFGKTQTPYAALGRQERPGAPLAPRMGVVEVVQARTGRTLLTLPLEQPEPAGAAPEALLEGNWAPLVFLVAVGDEGVVGAPVLIQGTGSPAVVHFLETHLFRDRRVGEQREITPGFYILRVGP